ncbi:MAG: septal ring lytic transglycosylase RlpA family protein [Polaromonas sp.]|nr:septal ring lytic transglycosylase RlpA family protein [Polaromonas sp.]
MSLIRSCRPACPAWPALLALAALVSGCVQLPPASSPAPGAQAGVARRDQPAAAIIPLPALKPPPAPAGSVGPNPAASSNVSGDTDPPPAPATVASPADGDTIAGEPLRELDRGAASWYGPRFHKRRTASGERYDMHAFTAAHRSLPFGTVVRVRSLVNGREVDVRINDRGPFSRTRIIDLSRAAADAIDMRGRGVKDVVLLVPLSTSSPEIRPAPIARKRSPARRTTTR